MIPGVIANDFVAIAAYSIWDVGSISGSISVYDHDLSAIGGAFNLSNQFVVAFVGKTVGDQNYFEVEIEAVTNQFDCIGFIATSHISGGVSSGLGPAYGFAYNPFNGIFYVSQSNSGTVGTAGPGANVGIALDFVNNNFWARINGGNWNGSALADPATNTGGFSLSFVIPSTYGQFQPIAAIGNSGDAFRANFGASPFAHPVPSGFTSGWSGFY
jgi:hypothetical protein